MKTNTTQFHNKNLAKTLIFCFFFIGFSQFSTAGIVENDTIGFNQYKGKIVDSKNKRELIFATLSVNGTNISTISNTQGEFLLKVPKKFSERRITISFLGYTSQVIRLADLSPENNIIKLETYIEELSEIRITARDAGALVKEMLKRRGDNYLGRLTDMTAFYRETIKKRRTYVSLSEAVVEINKQPYKNSRNDILKLHKARKSTDYTKLDTVTLKLRGGPFSTLYLDVMKNPDMFFTDDMTDNYEFHFETSTKIDNKVIYVVSFKQRPHIKEPYYYGTLYIDSQTLALTSAKFKLNLDDEIKASRLFVLKKPRKATVIPIQANYQIDYRNKDGKWYYGYSRIELGFKINWDKRLFNSVYYSTIEMAITDWKFNENNIVTRPKNRLRSSVVLSDEASGFSDPQFWGEYNVIEPEKPIESAIKKIQKQLKKLNTK